MTATVQIHEMTTTDTGVQKDTGTVRFKSANNTNVDTNDRLQIPSGAEIFSYTKQLCFYFSVGPATDIQNLRAYSDEADMGTGVNVDYDVSASYTTAIDTDIAGTDWLATTSGASVDMDAIDTGPHSGTGYKGDYLRLQMGVDNTAGPGAITPSVATFAYDET